MFDRIPLESHLALDSCFERLFVTNSISLLVVGLLNFLFLPVSILVVYMFLGIFPFLPDCPIYSLIIVCISVVLVVISPLSFLTLFIWVLSFFFLVKVGGGLSILLILSKNL